MAPDPLLSLFVSRVSNRLQRGAATYGDLSFDKPLATTADEILQELEDVAGWAAIAWVRISKQMQRVIDSSHALGLGDGPLRQDPGPQDVLTSVAHDRGCHTNHQAEQDGC